MRCCQNSCSVPWDNMNNSSNQPLPPEDSGSKRNLQPVDAAAIPRMSEGHAVLTVVYLGKGVYRALALDGQGRRCLLCEGSSVTEVRAYINRVVRNGDIVIMSDALRMLQLLEMPTASLRTPESAPACAPFLPADMFETVGGASWAERGIEAQIIRLKGASEANGPGRLTGIVDLRPGQQHDEAGPDDHSGDDPDASTRN